MNQQTFGLAVRNSHDQSARKLPAALLWVALLALLCGGCTATGVRINLAPLVDYELDRTQDSVRFNLFGPILAYEEVGDTSLFALRPLFSVYDNPTEERSAVHGIYPLVRHSKTRQDENFTILPLYNGQTYTDATGKRDSDYMLFPFIWYGDGDEPEDKYFAFFPLGGSIHGKLGLDEFNFVLFPAYVDTRYKDRKRIHVCWPFCAVTSEPDAKSDEERVQTRYWPFYGHYEKPGKFETSFVLWPFYTAGRTDLDTDNPSEGFSFFPFYAEKASAHSSNHLYLVLFQFGQDDRTDYKSAAFPWPFIVFESSDSHFLDRAWPFWNHSKRGDTETHGVAFPFVWWQEQNNDAWTKGSVWVLPLFWTHDKRFKDSNRHESMTKVWPLLGTWHDADGSERTEALSLFWFEDPEGFDRDWSPLWQLYTARTHPEAGERTDFLWGFVRLHRDSTQSFTDITPLFGYNSDAEGEGYTLLQGLFGIRSSAKETTVRLLWWIEI